MNSVYSETQHELCARFNVPHFPSPDDQKVGISLNAKDGIMPLNGLRHKPSHGTTGWYIWGGIELKQDEEFFKALHVSHINDWAPLVSKYLGLPPGWRFLIHGNYEDVWFDETLIQNGMN